MSEGVAAASRAGRRTPLSFARDLRVRTKLLASFGLVCMLLLVVGLTSLNKLANQQADLKAMYHVSLKSVESVDGIEEALNLTRVKYGDVAIAQNAAELARAAADLAAADNDLTAAIDEYAAMGHQEDMARVAW